MRIVRLKKRCVEAALSDDEVPTMDAKLGSLKEALARVEAFEAEREAARRRRAAIFPTQRLQENGNKLRNKIMDDPAMRIVLEVPASPRVKCRAEADCLHSLANAQNGSTIVQRRRVCVQGVVTEEFWRRGKYYYHVPHFQTMMDLKKLLPSKFKMDGSDGNWPLMVEPWFHYKGLIKLGVVAVYFGDRERYAEEQDDIFQQSGYGQARVKDNDGKQAPTPAPTPASLTKLRLRGFKTDQSNFSTLCDVLRHPGCRPFDKSWWMRFEAVDLETDSEDEDSDQRHVRLSCKPIARFIKGRQKGTTEKKRSESL